MFGLFKSKKSPVRQNLHKLLAVRRTWYEWRLENGEQQATLVVEFDYDLDPDSPDFYQDGLDEIWRTVRETEPGLLPRVRIVPRGSDG